MSGAFAAELARLLCGLPRPRRAVLGIDGVDGVGKTTLADALASALALENVVVRRVGMDGFHNPRAHRYRLGRSSPEGFYRDTTDYAAVRDRLIAPFRAGLPYAAATFDYRTDAPALDRMEPPLEAGILLVDGVFLNCAALEGCFDRVVFLSAPFEVTLARMARRDGGNPDPQALEHQRYRLGQELYFAERRPAERADILIDYADPAAPRLLRSPADQARINPPQ